MEKQLYLNPSLSTGFIIRNLYPRQQQRRNSAQRMKSPQTTMMISTGIAVAFAVVVGVGWTHAHVRANIPVDR